MSKGDFKMGALKRIIKNQLEESKRQLNYFENENEQLKIVFDDNNRMMDKIKKDIIEFEDFLNDEQTKG